jgi:transcriptional regulator with XRE-family HTH domain
MSSVQKTLGARIRDLRLKKGWSQEAFADICGIHRSHMGEIERGETNVTLSTLLVVAQHLEITITALFRGIA